MKGNLKIDMGNIYSIVLLYAISIYCTFSTAFTGITYGDIGRDFHLNGAYIKILEGLISSIPVLFAIPIGLVIDRFRRIHFVAVGILLFGIANALKVFANGFTMLVVLSIFTGFGFGLVQTGLLSLFFDYVTYKHRGIAFGLYLALSMICGGGAYMFSNFLFEHFHSWRLIYWIVGASGIFFSSLAFILNEPERDDNNLPPSFRKLVSTNKNLFKSLLWPVILLLIISGIFNVNNVYSQWIPIYIERYKGIWPTELVSISVMIILLFSVIISGFLLDLLTRFNVYANYCMIIVGIIVCFITTFAILHTQNHSIVKLLYHGYMAAGAFIGVPLIVLFLSLIKSKYRMTIYGTITFLIHVFGASLGGVAIGGLSDKFGLEFALGIISLFMVVSVVGYVLSGIYLSKEIRNS